MAGNYDVMYLSGVPGVGKTTLLFALQALVKPLAVIRYSNLLSQAVATRVDNGVSHADLRTHSATLVIPADVQQADMDLVRRVSKLRLDSHVIIDSHAVTKEDYGFRATPFSATDLQDLQPTRLVMLYADPDVIMQRIQSDDSVRKRATAKEVAIHQELQGSVLLSYAIHLGIPVHFIDTARTPHDIASEISKRFRHSG